MDEHSELRTVAEKIAAAGAAAADAVRRTVQRGEEAEDEPRRRLSLVAQRTAVAGLAQLRPGEQVVDLDHGRGDRPASGRVRWLIEPLGGAANFASALPAAAVSVTARRDGLDLVAAVAEPVSGWTWSAARGHGAVLGRPGHGKTPLRATRIDHLDRARVATGFHRDRSIRLRQGQVVGRLLGEVRELVTVGVPALHLCWVAAGFVDAAYEHGVDLAGWTAAALIAETAGAVVHRPDDAGPGAGMGEPVLAVAPGIAEDLVLALKRAGAEAVL